MYFLSLLCVGLVHLHLTVAKTVVFNWDITWVRAAPDGFERNVIGINHQWPCPSIEVDLGDRIIVHMNNMLGNQSTSLHWHGLHQNGTQDMDGASGITQCPVPPGSSFTYDFLADRPGTYWYHSHTMGQYPDGLFGPLLIHDPNPPFEFDEHLTITFMDWYHEEMPSLIHQYQSRSGAASDGTPNPVGSLINLSKNAKIHVKPNTTYYVHIICPGNYPGHAFLFDQHPMTTVEIDGTYVQPQLIVGGDEGNARVAPGQRQGVLLRTKPTADRNYGILTVMDANMLFINKGIRPPPKEYPMNCTAHLVYDDNLPLPGPPVIQKLGNLYFWDDLDYVPLNGEPLLGPVDHQIILETTAQNVSGVSRFAVNGKTHLGQKVPTLYSALTLPKEYVSNPLVYGQINPIIVKHNDIVEIVINNRNSNLHPWHLHGHQFQMLERPLPNSGPFNGTYGHHRPVPAVRDTFMIQNNAFGIIRFRANNPGVWSLHCHIEFHTVSGFIATLIEAPEVLWEQERKRAGVAGGKRPKNHEKACRAFPMLTAGNAAGNTKDPLNLKGANTCVNANEWGAIYPPKPEQCTPGAT